MDEPIVIHPPDKWHIGKELPLAMILALAVQTAGGVWWLAQVSSKLDYTISTLQQFQSERYTREDARRDRELIVQIIDGLKQHENEHDRRIQVLEGTPTVRLKPFESR